MASTMLDLPQPFGPTTPLIPGPKCTVVRRAKDLNPSSSTLSMYTDPPRWLSLSQSTLAVDFDCLQHLES